MSRQGQDRWRLSERLVKGKVAEGDGPAAFRLVIFPNRYVTVIMWI